MNDQAYSVRVPDGFPHVGSQSVRGMLARLFRERTRLDGDPGAGDDVLRLTLPPAQVHALCALADGDPPGVSLRRLVATFAKALPAPETHPARVLPVKRLRERVIESEIVRPRPRALPSAGDALPIPVWFDRENPNRVSYWRSLGTDSQRNIIESYDKMKSYGVAQSSVMASRANPTGLLLRLLIWLLDNPALLLLGLFLLFRPLAGRSSSGGASAPPGPRYPAWRPS